MTAVFILILAVAQEEKGAVKGKVVHKSVAKMETYVYVEEIPNKTFDAPKDPLRVRQSNKEFSPRVVPIVVGTTVEFTNEDAFDHNVNSPDHEKFDLGNWGVNDKRTYTFKKSGVYTLLCALHPEMIGFVLVLKTPYFVQTDKEGNFSLKDLPVGTWKLKVWNERLKSKQLEAVYEVKIEAGKEAEIQIQP